MEKWESEKGKKRKVIFHSVQPTLEKVARTACDLLGVPHSKSKDEWARRIKEAFATLPGVVIIDASTDKKGALPQGKITPQSPLLISDTLSKEDFLRIESNRMKKLT